ncbi:MAG: hypothetical protein ACE5SW_11895 [Nitrososphaeraceae archaeon]
MRIKATTVQITIHVLLRKNLKVFGIMPPRCEQVPIWKTSSTYRKDRK